MENFRNCFQGIDIRSDITSLIVAGIFYSKFKNPRGQSQIYFIGGLNYLYSESGLPDSERIEEKPVLWVTYYDR
jgi:hypothetical protein